MRSVDPFIETREFVKESSAAVRFVDKTAEGIISRRSSHRLP
jgi:hypothetical protein